MREFDEKMEINKIQVQPEIKGTGLLPGVVLLLLFGRCRATTAYCLEYKQTNKRPVMMFLFVKHEGYKYCVSTIKTLII